MKRENYISRDEYFMGIAVLSSQRSKDPSTQVGACIVNGINKIVGIGYNGLPKGISDESFSRLESDVFLESRNTYVVHAEANAILNSTKSLDNCIMYCTFFPCNECAKLILQSGIVEVVFLKEKKDKDHQKATRKMFEEVGMKMRQLDLKGKKIDLNFDNYY